MVELNESMGNDQSTPWCCRSSAKQSIFNAEHVASNDNNFF